MKTFARFLAIALISLLPTMAKAQTELLQYQPGPRLIDGSQLNKMVDTVNNLTQTTGTPGNVEVATLNGNAAISFATYYFTGTPAATDQVFFVATRAMKVVSISQVHSVAAGGASTLQVTKDDATDAPGAGTDLLSSAFDLNATANTVQAGALSATAADLLLAAGDRLAVDFANAIQSSDGVVVTVGMLPQ